MILCASRTRRRCSTGYFRSISRPAASDSSPDSSRACAVMVGPPVWLARPCTGPDLHLREVAQPLVLRRFPRGAEVRPIPMYRNVDRGVHPAAVAFAGLQQNHLLSVEVLWVQRNVLGHVSAPYVEAVVEPSLCRQFPLTPSPQRRQAQFSRPDVNSGAALSVITTIWERPHRLG
jgi:hypothetical protein